MKAAMKIRLFFLLIMTFIMANSGYTQEVRIPGEYHWQNRLLLVFDGGGDAYQKQQQIFLKEKAGLNERDLVIFRIGDGQLTDPEGKIYGKQASRQVREKYDIGPDEFAVLLIGKDGGVKLRQHEVLETEKLFAVIDAMPMRQREMRQRKGN
jgi:hypothetical protein